MSNVCLDNRVFWYLVREILFAEMVVSDWQTGVLVSAVCHLKLLNLHWPSECHWYWTLLSPVVSKIWRDCCHFFKVSAAFECPNPSFLR